MSLIRVRLSNYSPRVSHLVRPPRGVITLRASTTTTTAGIIAETGTCGAATRTRFAASSRRSDYAATNFELCYCTVWLHALMADSSPSLPPVVYWRRGCSNFTPVFTNSHRFSLRFSSQFSTGRRLRSRNRVGGHRLLYVVSRLRIRV